MTRLPDGSKAWFVRIRTPTRLTLNPISWEGWAVSAVFVAVVLGIWLAIAALRPSGLHVFATIGGVAATLAAGVLLIMIAVRKSAPSTPIKTGEKTMLIDDVRDHFRPRPGYWFVPKMFGLGATPVTWQGWALTLGFVALLLADLRFMPDLIAKIAIGAALLAAFLVLCIRTTDGGWRWRWGAGK